MTLRQVKHPQAILAVLASMDSATVNSDGVGQLDFLKWFTEARDKFIIAQRTMLEGNASFRQILPYTALTRRNAEGEIEYLAYQRTKKGGEPKLDDKVSIGWAGHVDLADVIWNLNTSVVSPLATFLKSLIREMGEELKIVDATTKEETTFLQVLHSKMASMIINQNTDPEIYHTGIVTILEVKDGFEFDVNEEELSFIGWLTAAQLLSPYGDQLEPWTAAILNNETMFSGTTVYRDMAQLNALDFDGQFNYLIEELTGASMVPESEGFDDLIQLLGGMKTTTIEKNFFQASYDIPVEPVLDEKQRWNLREAQREALKAWLVPQNLPHEYDVHTLNKMLSGLLNLLGNRTSLHVQLAEATPEQATKIIEDAIHIAPTTDHGVRMYKNLHPVEHIYSFDHSSSDVSDACLVAIGESRIIGFAGTFFKADAAVLTRGDLVELRIGNADNFQKVGQTLLPVVDERDVDFFDANTYDIITPQPFAQPAIPTVKINGNEVKIVSLVDEPAWGRDTEPLPVVYLTRINLLVVPSHKQ